MHKATNSDITITAVIPVHRDLETLSALIERLQNADGKAEQSIKQRVDEIVVVDGNDAAECRQLCETRNCEYLVLEPNRGRQLDAGAERATGDVLWFLHADSVPPRSGPERIRRRIEAGYVGGYFSFSFTGKPGWHKTMLAGLINTRARIGIPYGDQGLFVSRAAYRDSARFAPTPLFEEVRLVRSLRRMGPFGPLRTSIGVSPRRWERDGWIRRTVNNRLLAMAHAAGVPPERLARHYDRPEPG